jgi:hypothetical protein
LPYQDRAGPSRSGSAYGRAITACDGYRRKCACAMATTIVHGSASFPFQFNPVAPCRALFVPSPFGPFSYYPFCGRPLPCCSLLCWCVLPVRLVFLCVPHAQACRKLRGTRDTTPDLCRSLCCLPRLHPSWRRCRASCWSRTIEVSCFTRRSAGRDEIAVLQRARGERAMIGIALRDQMEGWPGRSITRGRNLRQPT